MGEARDGAWRDRFDVFTIWRGERKRDRKQPEPLQFEWPTRAVLKTWCAAVGTDVTVEQLEPFPKG